MMPIVREMNRKMNRINSSIIINDDLSAVFTLHDALVGYPPIYPRQNYTALRTKQKYQKYFKSE